MHVFYYARWESPAHFSGTKNQERLVMKPEYNSVEEFATLLKADRIYSKSPRGFALSKDEDGDDVLITAWTEFLSMLSGKEACWHIFNDYKVRKLRDFPPNLRIRLMVIGWDDILNDIVIDDDDKKSGLSAKEYGDKYINPVMEALKAGRLDIVDKMTRQKSKIARKK